jgi:4-amino-4-deoxy-L-arabinose transferase-like glycosyltransferase
MNERRVILILLGIALLLRLGWVSFQSRQPDPRLGDQFEYLELGRNLLHTGQLFFHDPRFDQDVYAYRTPGYPVFVALCGGNVTAIRIAQALIDTSTVLAIYILARLWLGTRPSLVAAALVAFNPFLLYFTVLILTETLFTAMLAWGLYLARPTHAGLMRTSGLLLLGLAAMVRPGAIALIPPLVAASYWTAVVPPRKIAGAMFASAAIVFCLFSLWARRNANHPSVRAWIWTTTNAGITAYDGFHDGATGASDQKPFLDELLPDLRQMNEVQRDRFLHERAHAWTTRHRARASKLAVIKIARTWSPIPLSHEYGTRLYIVAGLLYSVPFDVLILLGLMRSQLPRSVKFLLVVPAIYFTAVGALSVGSLRYRLPAEPPMAVLAGSVLAVRASGARRSDQEETTQETTPAPNGPSRLDNPGRPL